MRPSADYAAREDRIDTGRKVIESGSMPLVFKIAYRNLFHDRLRFIATVVGIVFSIVLVTVQMGLFLSFDRMVTTMFDHAGADLWITARGTKCFEDATVIDERERYPGAVGQRGCHGDAGGHGFRPVAAAGGGTTPVFMIGSESGGRDFIRGMSSRAASKRCRCRERSRSIARISID